MIRQQFIKQHHWSRYIDLYHLLKTKDVFRELPIQTSQQVLRLLDKNWKSFFKAIKDWKNHPEKYLGRPKLPRYKPKDGESIVNFTNQQCKIKDGYLYFPKITDLKPIKTRIGPEFHQVRILPRGEHYIIEIVHEKEIKNLNLNNKRILGMDLGVENLVTSVNNADLHPFVVKGGIVKSTNQYYNKKTS